MSTTLALLLLVAASPPMLTADTATVDRGEVLGGPMLKHTFRVTNNHGSETLTITGLDSTCGCLRRSISKTELKPGDVTEVTVEINTLTQPDGPQTWVFTLKHRSSLWGKTQPDAELQLRLKAKILREVSVSPPMVAMTTQTEATTTITLADKREKPLSVKSLATTSKLITAKQSVKPNGGAIVIELTFSGDILPGTHDESLIITTDDPQYSELRVPIRCIKKSTQHVLVQPEVLDIEVKGEKASGIFQLRRTDGKSLQITGVESQLPGVTATWSTGSGNVATVKVSIAKTMAGEKGKGELVVKFTEPNGHERKLPIAWSSD